MDREEYERLKNQYSEESEEFLQHVAEAYEFTEEAKMAAKEILDGKGIKVEIRNNTKPIVENNHKSGSTVGEAIKMVAWIQLIVSLLIALIFYTRVGILTILLAIIGEAIAFLVLYALGEICCLLADIKKNTMNLNKP